MAVPLALSRNDESPSDSDIYDGVAPLDDQWTLNVVRHFLQDIILQFIFEARVITSKFIDTDGIQSMIPVASMFRELQPRIPENTIVKEKTTVGLAGNTTVMNSDTRV